MIKRILSAIAAAAISVTAGVSVFAANRDSGAVGNVVNAGESIINDVVDAGENIVDGVTDAVTGENDTTGAGNTTGGTTGTGSANDSATGAGDATTTPGDTTQGTDRPGTSTRPETDSAIVDEPQKNPSTGVGMSYAFVTAAASAVGMAAVAFSKRRS